MESCKAPHPTIGRGKLSLPEITVLPDRTQTNRSGFVTSFFAAFDSRSGVYLCLNRKRFVNLAFRGEHSKRVFHSYVKRPGLRSTLKSSGLWQRIVAAHRRTHGVAHTHLKNTRCVYHTDAYEITVGSAPICIKQ